MKKTVLVIDDDKGILRLIENILTNEGFEVVALDHPHFALKTIREREPHLVVLDIIMPQIDGYKLCEEIKKLYKNLPVMLITSQPYEKDFIKDSYKDFQADDYMLKPLQAEAFLKKVKKILS